VTFIDLTTSPPSVIGTPLSIGTATESTAITGSGTFAVTADGSGGNSNVSSINIAGRTSVSTLSLPATAVAITPNNNVVILIDSVGNQFEILNISPLGVLTDSGQRIANGGTFPLSLTMAPNGSLALAANFFSNDISILRIDALGSVTLSGSRIAVGANPGGIAITPDGTRAYVLLFNSTVAVLSIDAGGNVTDTGARIAIPNGTGPDLFFGVPGIAVSPDGQHVYVANNSAGTITILSTATNSVTATVAVGAQPAGIGVQ
jgi:YVTN family beta-propeller protein